MNIIDVDYKKNDQMDKISRQTDTTFYKQGKSLMRGDFYPTFAQVESMIRDSENSIAR